jgi:hypothetical protein
MSDNSDQNVKSVVDSWVHTWHSGRQMSRLSVQTKVDSFIKPALLHKKK